MKVILTAINAKYIHSNLAVYCLKAYAEEYTTQKDKTLKNIRKNYKIRNSQRVPRYQRCHRTENTG